MTIFTTYDKINSFKRKLDLYKSQLKKKDISAFPNLSSFIDENELSLKENLNVDILEHLEVLKTNFSKYFSEVYSKKNWIRNPFLYESSEKEVPEDVEDRESFIDMVSDSSMIDSFKEKTLVSFWMSTKIQSISFQASIKMFNSICHYLFM